MASLAALLSSPAVTTIVTPIIAATPATLATPGKVAIRAASERVHANIGWLNGYHSLSSNARSVSFHSLFVLNEDRVAPSRGFPLHPHVNAEIFSYIVNGTIAHVDSMNNKESLSRGDLQFTSAGRGIRHGEANGSDKELVHFIQIWVLPHTKGLTPNYQTIHVPDTDKINKFALLVAPVGSTEAKDGAPKVDDAKSDGKASSLSVSSPFARNKGKVAAINQDIRMYASILQPDQTITFTLPAGRVGYVHLIQDVASMTTEHDRTHLIINGALLHGGDGAYVTSASPSAAIDTTVTFTCKGTHGTAAEFLLFDIKQMSKDDPQLAAEDDDDDY